MTRTLLFSALFAALMIGAASFGYVAGTQHTDDASCTSLERAKPGLYKGSINGPHGPGEITINIKGTKVTGNMKGQIGGTKWNGGITGTITKGAVSASGSNPGKKTSMTLRGSVCGKSLMGSLTGKALDKDAWYLVNVSR